MFLVLFVVTMFTGIFFSCGKDDDDEIKSDACDIVSFTVDGTAWTISGTNITYVYPEGTSGTRSPVIVVSDGAAVNPASGVAQDFFTASGVTYTVTAEDGVTKKTYTAKASIAAPVAVFAENFDSYTDLESFFGGTGGTPPMTWILTSTSTTTVNLSTISGAGKLLQLYNTNTVKNQEGIEPGRSYITGSLSTFSSPYKTTLGENAGDVIWTFNMRASGSANAITTSFNLNPPNYQSVVVLVSTTSDLLSSTAQGYGVTIRKGDSHRAPALIRFDSGLGSNSSITEIIGSGIESGNYFSIKVVYSPATDSWILYVRDDESTSNPQDPASGILTPAGSEVDNTYTSTPMTSCGFFYNHGVSEENSAAKASYDNFSVTVVAGPEPE